MNKNGSMADKVAPVHSAAVASEARVLELEAANQVLRTTLESQAAMVDSLKASERKYRDLVNSAIDGICILQDQVLTYVNPQLCEMMEYPAERLIGTSFTDHLAEEEKQRSANLYRRMTSRETFPKRYETVLVSASGVHLDVGVSANMAEVDGVPSVVAVVHDIAGQKKARQVAVENERLEAVRTMARGVGNNFSNILSVINSYAASIADSFLPNTRPHESARKILDAARHAGELTKRLLGVVRVSGHGSDVRVQPVALVSAVQKACELIIPTLKESGITLELQGGSDDLHGMADAGQLLDVLMNILLNGSDAMPQGGTLTVRVSESAGKDVTPAEDVIATVQVSVTDTGIGMTDQQVSRVFEPFYTTKVDRDAFGLGLSVAQSMVNSWGGQIEISSQPGVGTTVTIRMRRADPPLREEGAGSDGERFTVLLVEDHAGRRRMMAQVLESLGYSVIEAADGEQAITIYREKADGIDLTVLDWMMPGVDGREVLQVIQAHDPESKVLMTSGFSRDYVRSQVRMGAWAFLQKPFSAEQFKESVGKVLGLRAK